MTQQRNIAFVASMYLLGAGFPFTLVGLPIYLGQEVAAAVILLGAMGWVWLVVRGVARIGRWEIGLIAYFAYCVIVSLISSTAIFPQSWTGWVPALYTIVPLLLIFPFKLMRVKIGDAATAIILVAVIGSLLVGIDQFYRIGFLDQYQRGSVFGSIRRVVLVRTEMALALVMCFARLLDAKRWLRRLLYAGCIAVVTFALFVVSEGRLSIAGSMIGCFIYFFVMYKNSKKPFVTSIIIIVLAIVLPLLLGKYITYLSDIGDIRANDRGIAFRVIEYGYFEAAFEKTHGIGFGVMSAGESNHNVVSFASKRAGYMYGTGSYGVELSDLGLWAALFQFGYIGLALVVLMTVAVIRKLWIVGRANNSYPYRAECGAVAAVVIGFMISPLPINLFSLAWTVEYGGLLWFLAAAAVSPRDFARSNQSKRQFTESHA